MCNICKYDGLVNFDIKKRLRSPGFKDPHLLAMPCLEAVKNSQSGMHDRAICCPQDQWAEVKHAHALETTQLRLADKAITLKAMTAVDNPIIRKRKRR